MPPPIAARNFRSACLLIALFVGIALLSWSCFYQRVSPFRDVKDWVLPPEENLSSRLIARFGNRSRAAFNASIYSFSSNRSPLLQQLLSAGGARRRERPLVRLVHQSWKTTLLPTRFALWSRTWRDCFPDWIHVLWTDEDNERFVRDEYPWFLERYRSFSQHIYRVDSVRYLYLHRFGGIYTDLDNVCLRPFGHLLEGRALVFGDMESNYKHPSPHFQYVQNSFLYSVPGHPFWLELVHRIGETSRGESGRPEYVTGPQALMKLLVDRWDDYQRDITLFGPNTFNPFSWITRDSPLQISPCLDLNQMSDNRLRDCIAHHKKNGSYVLQLHTHSWGAPTIQR